MTKLQAEKQLKDKADQDALNKQFAGDYAIDALTTDVPYAQQVLTKARNRELAASQDPLIRSYVNKNLSEKRTQTPTTPEETEAWRNYQADMTKYKALKLGYEQRKATGDPYNKQVLSDAYAAHPLTQQDIDSAETDAEKRAFVPIRTFQKGTNIPALVQSSVAPILEKFKKEVANIKPETVNGVPFFNMQKNVDSTIEEARNLLRQTWNDWAFDRYRTIAIKQAEQAKGGALTKEEKDVVLEEAYKNTLGDYADNLVIKNIEKTGMQIDPRFQMNLDIAKGRALKKQEFVPTSKSLVIKGKSMSFKSYETPVGEKDMPVRSFVMPEYSFYSAGNKAGDAYQSNIPVTGQPYEVNVLYIDDRTKEPVSKEYLPTFLKNGGTYKSQGYQNFGVPNTESLNNVLHSYNERNEASLKPENITIEPNKNAQGQNIFAFDAEGKKIGIGAVDLDLVSVPLGDEQMVRIDPNWQNPNKEVNKGNVFNKMNEPPEIVGEVINRTTNQTPPTPSNANTQGTNTQGGKYNKYRKTN
jgi:hypothetical protein